MPKPDAYATVTPWLISDVYLEAAISEVATRRSKFAAILKSQGVDGLIAALNPARWTS